MPILVDGAVSVIDTEKEYSEDGYIPDFAFMEGFINLLKKDIISGLI